MVLPFMSLSSLYEQSQLLQTINSSDRASSSSSRQTGHTILLEFTYTRLSDCGTGSDIIGSNVIYLINGSVSTLAKLSN